MAKARKKTKRVHQCVPARWGPNGTYGRGYRCRSAYTGTWIAQRHCKSCPASYKPKKR